MTCPGPPPPKRTFSFHFEFTPNIRSSSTFVPLSPNPPASFPRALQTRDCPFVFKIHSPPTPRVSSLPVLSPIPSLSLFSPPPRDSSALREALSRDFEFLPRRPSSSQIEALNPPTRSPELREGCLSFDRITMASSQSSSLDNDFVMESPTCWCGLKTPLKTSYTKKNPGRRFFACPKYNTEDARCEFFVWADIFQLLVENMLLKQNSRRNTWDDVLCREYAVRKREEKVREIAKNLKKEKRKLFCLYWIITFVILFAWFG
ncbi:uncharacterized protein LOC121256484 [Juglans microcarpa x Juglans regia]|uniref:uncharacterized protein LOC121256484 n=1 Tax=Juglans microcarpa x Juglans regia TaxID=2249226 RepID=UPI001B7E56EC|nr:uncharacterized protein LOC121256484 [Juglans microcarpa x Juglans regia]